LIVYATVGRWRRRLTGQSAAPPDGPVIFSHDVFFFPESDEFIAEDLGVSTDDSPDSPVIYSHVAAPIPESGQFGAPQAGAVLAEPSQSFSISFPLLLAMSLALR
jgi:hypothetical protein